jgi:hypothetical protein
VKFLKVKKNELEIVSTGAEKLNKKRSIASPNEKKKSQKKKRI